LARAAPRIAGLVVGLVLIRRADDVGVLFLLGITIFVLSLPLGNPAAWWRYVRAGQVRRDEPEYEQGDFRVVLRAAGSRSLDVVKAVREVTGVGAGEAKTKVDIAPTTIAIGLSEASATRVCERLQQAGATAVVVRGPES